MGENWRFLRIGYWTESLGILDVMADYIVGDGLTQLQQAGKDKVKVEMTERM
jgi:hypothetical protein